MDLIFQITELLVNITKHVLKPRHDVLTEEEKQKLLNKFSVEDSQVQLDWRFKSMCSIASFYELFILVICQFYIHLFIRYEVLFWLLYS